MVIGLLSQIVNPAEASVIKFGNINITLPDSVTITGAEAGTGARNCSFKVSVDADAGTTIPLRAMVVVNLVDALGTTIDNNYSQATVEGLTHQEFIGVFHCNASVGTLKPPYKFSGSVLGVPSSSLPFIEAPVTVTFVTATPSASPTPTATKSSSQDEAQALNLLNQYTPKVATLEKLKEQIASWYTQYPKFFIANPEFNASLQAAIDYKVVVSPTQKDVDFINALLGGEDSGLGVVPLMTHLQGLIAKQASEDLATAKIAIKKLVTITCIKGKSNKKVTAIKPVCPSGYKKK